MNTSPTLNKLQTVFVPVGCEASIKEVTKFETTDGELFYSKEGAEYHQREVVIAAYANEMLDSGNNVADILRTVGKEVSDPILESVTKNSQFAIPHWQCRETPGYKPQTFSTGMNRIMVYGHAGSWSGSYGKYVNMTDVIQYAKDKRSIL